MFTRKDLAKLLLPLIVEQLLAVLVGMADVVMVAAVGETAVSGVSLVDSISILIIQMLAALATGGSVVCAQYIGKKQPENACEAAGQLILVTTMVSVVIAVIALIGNRHLLAMIFGKVENSVMEKCPDIFLAFRIIVSISGSIQLLRCIVPGHGQFQGFHVCLLSHECHQYRRKCDLRVWITYGG